MKFDVKSGSKSIYCGSNYGPTFGKEHAIYVANNANENELSYSNLGQSFKHPKYEYESDEAKTFLAGFFNFQISEIEVYRRI